MKSFLTTLGFGLFIILAGLFIGPRYVDWNNYRDVFELHTSNLIGRDVKVNGSVNLRLLPVPYLVFEKIQIAGDDDNPEQTFIQAEAFKLWLAVPPLFRGVVEAKKVELTKPYINLQIDNKGRGNWRGLGKSLAPLPYVPKDISLASVVITDGRVFFAQDNLQEPVVLEQVTGNLSAGSLKGPYRFKGHFDYASERRHLNIVTSRQDDTHSMQIKSLIDIPATGSKYLLDGYLRNLNRKGSLEAVLQGQVPIDLLSRIEKKVDGQSVPFQSYQGNRFIQVKSNVKADLKRVEFNDLSITIDDTRRPQNIKGAALLDWNDGIELKTELSATWLDFDEMLGEDQAVRKIGDEKQEQDTAVKRLVGLFSGTLQSMGNFAARATVSANITEAKVGGSELSDFNFSLTKSNQEFRITRLSAELPGRNQLNLSGQLIPEGRDLTFSGPVRLKGVRLGALTHWALFKEEQKGAFQSAPYVLQGNVSYAPGRFAIQNLRGELNGSGVSGVFRYDFSERKEFMLEIDSDNVDVSDVLPENATLKSLVTDMLSLNSSASQTTVQVQDQRSHEEKFNDAASKLQSAIEQSQIKGSAPKPQGNTNTSPKRQERDVQKSFLQTVANMKGRINLRIGQLKLPGLPARDFVADGTLQSGRFNLRSLSMVSRDGLVLQGRGTISSLDTNSNGTLRFNLKASSPKSMQQLIRQMDLPKHLVQDDNLHQALSPLQLAINLNMRSGNLPSTDVIISGSAARSQVTLNLRHEGALATLGSRHLDLSGSLKNNSSQALIRQLAGVNLSNASGTQGRGVLNILASGTPERGIDTRILLDAGTTQARYNGTLKITEKDSSGKGKLTLKSNNAASGLGLLGFREIASFHNDPMNLTVQLKKTNEIYDISDFRGNVGSIKLAGKSKIDLSQEPMKVSANISTSEASLPTMLSYLVPLEAPTEVRQALNITNGSSEEGWSKLPFNTSFLKQVRGDIVVKFYRLALSDRARLSDGELHAQFNDNGLKFKKLNGTLFGGKFSSSAELFARNGGIGIEGKLSLKKADLAEMFKTRQGAALARGAGNLSFDFSGEGLSPLGMVAVMKGNGKLTLQNGEIFNFSPNALSYALSATRGTPGANNNKTLIQAFKNQLPRASFPFRKIGAPILLSNGTFRMNDVSASAQKTQVKASTRLELANMKVDSVWSVKMKNPTQGKLSNGVNVKFSGLANDLGAIKPVIDSGDLQTSLEFQQVEEKLKTLEGLNNRDPDSIRRVRERAQQRGFANTPREQNQSINTGAIPPLSTKGTASQRRQRDLQQDQFPQGPQAGNQDYRGATASGDALTTTGGQTLEQYLQQIEPAQEQNPESKPKSRQVEETEFDRLFSNDG